MWAAPVSHLTTGNSQLATAGAMGTKPGRESMYCARMSPTRRGSRAAPAGLRSMASPRRGAAALSPPRERTTQLRRRRARGRARSGARRMQQCARGCETPASSMPTVSARSMTYLSSGGSSRLDGCPTSPPSWCSAHLHRGESFSRLATRHAIRPSDPTSRGQSAVDSALHGCEEPSSDSSATSRAEAACGIMASGARKMFIACAAIDSNSAPSSKGEKRPPSRSSGEAAGSA
mmetsp:Transcript_27917/g.89630  ORF Transcript_27917/g.89630 Transcript_27917/m.89630 type:complete len:233 (-) Transcript_27917:461-1159(-)